LYHYRSTPRIDAGSARSTLAWACSSPSSVLRSWQVARITSSDVSDCSVSTSRPIADHSPETDGFLHVCLAGAFAAGPLIASWLANNTPEAGVRPLVIGMNGYSNIAGVSESLSLFLFRLNRTSTRSFSQSLVNFSNRSMRQSMRRLSSSLAAFSFSESSCSSRSDCFTLVPTVNVKPSSRRCQRRTLRRSDSMRSVAGIKRGPLFMDCDPLTLKACVVNQTKGNGTSFVSTLRRSRTSASRGGFHFPLVHPLPQ
jgi:hypothetical protein